MRDALPSIRALSGLLSKNYLSKQISSRKRGDGKMQMRIITPSKRDAQVEGKATLNVIKTIYLDYMRWYNILLTFVGSVSDPAP